MSRTCKETNVLNRSNTLKKVLACMAGLPRETIARAQYYLAQALSRAAPTESLQISELIQEAQRSMLELTGLSQKIINEHLIGCEAVLYDSLVSPCFRLWTVRSDQSIEKSVLMKGSFSASLSTTICGILWHENTQTVSGFDSEVDTNCGYETQSGYVIKKSTTGDGTKATLEGHAQTAARSGDLTWMSKDFRAERKDITVRSKSSTAAVSSEPATSIEATNVPLESAKRFTAKAVANAAQIVPGSLSQGQVDFAYATGVATLAIAAVTTGVNGYSTVQSARAATRTAAANERIATAQEATLEIQQKRAAKNDDEPDARGGDDSGSPSKPHTTSLRKSSRVRSSAKAKTYSPKAINHSKPKVEAANILNKLPSSPPNIPVADFPSVPTTPCTSIAQNNDNRSKDEDAEPDTAVKTSSYEVSTPRETNNMQRNEADSWRARRLSGELQRIRYDHERKAMNQDVTKSSSTESLKI